MDKEDVQYTMEYYSAIKKQWNNAICSNMDGPRDYHTKWSTSEKDKYMGNLKKKNDTNEFTYQVDSNLCLSKGKVGREKLEIWD